MPKSQPSWVSSKHPPNTVESEGRQMKPCRMKYRVYPGHSGWHWLYNINLKGKCHFPQTPKYPIRAVANFFENSQRYSQFKVDTGGKFDTGGAPWLANISAKFRKNRKDLMSFFRIRNPDPGGQKWPTEVEFFFLISCFEVVDGLFWELKASFVTWTFFMEA